MSELPRKESPLAQCRLPARRRDGVRAGVVLKEQKFQVQMNLRGDPGDDAFISAVEGELGIPLPLQANTISHKHDLVIAWLGPDEWLLIGQPGNGSGYQTTTREKSFGLTLLLERFEWRPDDHFRVGPPFSGCPRQGLHPGPSSAGFWTQSMCAVASGQVLGPHHSPDQQSDCL